MKTFPDLLLNWYDQNHRDLPWRAAPKKAQQQPANPYHVWLSEIMLQQTTVTAVIPYFQNFITRWPTVIDLAAADLDDVLHAWQGLGYYSRARNLHKTAQIIHLDHQGLFPSTAADLQKLPGIGPYTAGAIAAIAFGQKTAGVDGNIERVISRVYWLTKVGNTLRQAVTIQTQNIIPPNRPGDFLQAMMDLGSSICTPKNPNCTMCPLHTICQAHLKNKATDVPRKKPKVAQPTRLGNVYWITNTKGEVWVRKREAKGLLGGLMEFPSSDWTEQLPTPHKYSTHTDKQVKHTFTHFHLILDIHTIQQDKPFDNHGYFIAPSDLHTIALPTLMKKVSKIMGSKSLVLD